VRWLIDGNNVMGARPDGWWNDRSSAATRLTQQVAEWCRRHDDEVTLVFDLPVAEATLRLAGGNLSVLPAERAGRNAADDLIATLAALAGETDPASVDVVVVTSDRGLRARLPAELTVRGAGTFRDMLDAATGGTRKPQRGARATGRGQGTARTDQ
jgi:hypothetical protein